ncbi:MAG: LysR family transcriptional regulator [Bdellovibrionota bacterium]
MQRLYYELETLSRAIHYKNLSAAAIHVGVSQPQLSRIIGKIEEELKVVLLDRTAKRKSAWTQVAFDLSLVFERHLHRLDSEIQILTQDTIVSELKIGTLEGLTLEATKLSRRAIKDIGVRQVSLDIFDLNDLESHFLMDHLDLILTSKFPSRQKFKHAMQIGYQDIEMVKSDPTVAVLSSFEYGKAPKKTFDNFKGILISNSLSVRKNWLSQVGGTGSLPSEMKKGAPKDKEPVYVIASDLISPSLWEKLEKILQSL